MRLSQLGLVSATSLGALIMLAAPGCGDDSTSSSSSGGTSTSSSSSSGGSTSSSSGSTSSSSGGATCGGLLACGATCVDSKNDAKNCGACGKTCAGSEVCVAGTCGTVCPTGTEKCGDKCVDKQTDRANCGACGTTCAAGSVCSAGACSASCGAGLTTCGTGATAYCANVTNDEKNCGTCGNACSANQACVANTVSDAGAGDAGDAGASGFSCRTVCAAGQIACGATCASPLTDANNCGACGVVCGAGLSCVSGACRDTSLVSEWKLNVLGLGGVLPDTGTLGGNDAPPDPASGFTEVRNTQDPSYTDCIDGQGCVLVQNNRVPRVAVPVNLPLGKTARTISVWFRPLGTSDGTYNGLLSYGPRGAANASQLLSYTNGVRVSSANWSNDLIQTTGTAAGFSFWHHAAFTFDGVNARKLYLNGVEVAADALGAPIDTQNGALRIGSTDDPGRSAIAYMNNLRIYRSVRTAEQILAEASEMVRYNFEDNLRDSWQFRQDAVAFGNAPAYVAGRNAAAGKAIAFDGTANSHVQTKRAIWRGAAHENNAPYTYAFWMKADDVNLNGNVIQLADNLNGGGYCYAVARFDGASKKLVMHHYNGGSGVNLTAATAFASGTWYHVALTYSQANGIRLYINGVQDANNAAITTQQGNGASPRVFILGSARGGAACLNSTATNFKGAMDDFRVYARELTAAQVQALAQ